MANDDVIFDATGIVEALKGRGYDTKAIETPYEPRPASKYNSVSLISGHIIGSNKKYLLI